MPTFLLCLKQYLSFTSQNAWIEGQAIEPSTIAYKNGDGFDVYVDAARFLPDSCAFVKVMYHSSVNQTFAIVMIMFITCIYNLSS